MRIRTALVGVLVVVAASLGFVSPAGASESIGSCVAEVAAHINELMAEGETEADAIHHVEGEAEGCVEAPNPVLPELNEIVWVTLAFAVLMLVGVKFAWPAITAAMEARTEKIRSDLEAAEQTRLDAEAEADKYRSSLGDAQAESARILDEARTAAESVRAERIAAADAEAADIRAKAAADAESIKAQALADLRSEVVALAVGAAEQVVQRNLDAGAQTELIENYINQVGSQN